MRNACRVPTSGSEFGKYSLAKTRPVTVLYRKKSYHSIVVPTVLAMTARRSCRRCSASGSEESAAVDVAMVGSADMRPQTRGLIAAGQNCCVASEAREELRPER